jgi:hypothetical protein
MALSNMNHIFGWFRLLIGQIDILKVERDISMKLTVETFFFRLSNDDLILVPNCEGPENMYRLFVRVLYQCQYQVFT